MATLSLTLIEIIVLMVGAITLGITIHFFIVSRRSLKSSTLAVSGKANKELENWKLRYFNDVESRDRELISLKKRLSEVEENDQINLIEAEETRKRNKELLAEIEGLRKAPQQVAISSADRPAYITQLQEAHSNLLAQHSRITDLLGQIDLVKESEEREQGYKQTNEELTRLVEELQQQIEHKEREITNTRQKENLTSEMTSRLDSAYNEFHVLQDKILKLETQLNMSKRTSLNYEDLKESHQNLVRDHEEQKIKYNSTVSELKDLKLSLEDTEDRLKEANFHRQQLQKKVSYLEELNNDMQAVSDANKKLEGQLKRIGELESMLNVVATERDELARKGMNA